MGYSTELARTVDSSNDAPIAKEDLWQKLFGMDLDAESGPFQHFLMERSTSMIRMGNRSGMSATLEPLQLMEN
jgi:hypothetical protein